MNPNVICDNYLIRIFNVEIIIKNKLINLTKLMMMMCKYGYIEGVKTLLMIGFDPSINDSCAIGYASMGGYVEIVKLLLEDNRIDPSIDGKSICLASCCGHNEVVKLLLTDGRVSPNDIYCKSYDKHDKLHNKLCHALYNTRSIYDIMNVYLIDDNFYDDVSAIGFAVRNRHIEVVKLLSENKKFDSSYNHNYEIGYASKNGYIEIVKLLLMNKKVDPGDRNNYAIRLSSEKGHIKVVKLLLKNKRVAQKYNK